MFLIDHWCRLSTYNMPLFEGLKNEHLAIYSYPAYTNIHIPRPRGSRNPKPRITHSIKSITRQLSRVQSAFQNHCINTELTLNIMSRSVCSPSVSCMRYVGPQRTANSARHRSSDPARGLTESRLLLVDIWARHAQIHFIILPNDKESLDEFHKIWFG